MREKLSGRELMEYLWDTASAMSKLAQEYGVTIYIFANLSGNTSVGAGKYDHTKYKDGHEKYTYGFLEKGMDCQIIDPRQIVSLTMPPVNISNDQEGVSNEKRAGAGV